MALALTALLLPSSAGAEIVEDMWLDEPPWASNAALPSSAEVTNEGDFKPHRIRTVDSEKVKAVLADNPDFELIICIAGCKGGAEGHASVLARRPHVDRLRFAAMLNAGASSLNQFSGEGPANTNSGAAAVQSREYEEIICLAGCDGPIGMVVWRGMRLIWISKEQQAGLKDALTSLAARLLEAEQRRETNKGRSWVSADARNRLMDALGGEARVARLGFEMAAKLMAKPNG